MNTYIARQPIFDRKMNIFGYELLHRESEDNFFSGIDDDQATAQLIYNTFLVMGLYELTEGTTAFINFSKDLINSDVPFLLPKHNVVVEILERNEVTTSTVSACKNIKSMGYKLALDDFIFDQNNAVLIDMVDIIKIEFSSVNLEEQDRLIKKYGHRVKFLAEKVEKREDYELAKVMGYQLFQGYFFSKPSIIKSIDLVALNVNFFSILEELSSSEPRYNVIASIFKRDLGLSFKLLKLANSVDIGARNKITSIPQALSYIGINKLYQWISLMMLKDVQNVENTELVKQSLIRGKFMEVIAPELKIEGENSEFFFTGIFSSIDVLLNSPMEQVLKGLPLSTNVKNALLGEENEQGKLLNIILDWEIGEGNYPIPDKYMELYLKALKWSSNLNY